MIDLQEHYANHDEDGTPEYCRVCHPEMQTQDREYLTCAETAKLVRAALKREFPGVKFSVRSDTYSMGASIRVRWTNGPTQSNVQAVTNQYAGGRFDSMIDLAYGAEHWLTPDGRAILHRTYGHSYASENVTLEHRTAPKGSRLVHFGANYVFADRDLSPEFTAELWAEIAVKFGYPTEYDEMYRLPNGGYAGELVWRASQEEGKDG